MAILSFKKKDKEGDFASMSSPMSEVGLGGSSLSLGGLGGDIGSLSSLGGNEDSSEALENNLLSMSGARQDERKLQELEASLNDIRKQAETSELASRAMKSDIDAIKGDLSQINESIKSLLNVYEAVSSQFNPFVENGSPRTAATVNDMQATDDLLADDEQPASISEAISDRIEELARNEPFDDDGPLDRIVRPDDDFVETYPLIPGIQEKGRMERKIEHTMNYRASSDSPKPASAPVIKTSSYEDAYALEQARRLIDYLMGKVCRERAMGKEINPADKRALDLWIGEFKRLGGL